MRSARASWSHSESEVMLALFLKNAQADRVFKKNISFMIRETEISHYKSHQTIYYYDALPVLLCAALNLSNLWWCFLTRKDSPRACMLIRQYRC